jgi:hypothetical protein
MTEIAIYDSKRGVKRLKVTKTVSSGPIRYDDKNYQETNIEASCTDVKSGKIGLDSSLDIIRESNRCSHLAYPRFGFNFDLAPSGRLRGGDDNE